MAGTVVLRAVITVGAAFIGCHPMEMEFRLLVNVTECAVCLRDHPSGTWSVTWPVAEANGTYTVVSGMSPGGLLSAGTGACEDAPATGLDEPATAGWVLGWGCVLAAVEPLEPAEPHPARIKATAAAAMAPIPPRRR